MSDKKIIVSDNLDELIAMHQKVQGSTLIVLCSRGRLEVELNQEHFEVGEDDLLICHAGFIVGQYMPTSNFKCFCVMFAPHALDDVLYISLREVSGVWDKARFLTEHPIIHINDKQRRLARAFRLLIAEYKENNNDPYKSHMYSLLAQMAVLEMISWIETNQSQTIDASSETLNHKDAICRRFIDLLQATRGTQREVQWFAHELAVSPKYLSVVTKEKLGKTAIQLIQRFTCNEIRQRLLSSNAPIKEIAYEMKFASTTFFCKYVRAYMGTSPQELRQQGEDNPSQVH